ncbi:MAG TPA: radical SAM protein [Anaerolineae bacterium]
MLQDIATYMHLEPAEEVRFKPSAIPNSAPAVAPCGQVLEPDKGSTPGGRSFKKETPGVFHAAVPGGKSVPILKTLLTSACERNCYYCPFRAGRNYRRTTFKPEEMAKVFMDMHRAGVVQGLFLSSGIIQGGARTQDRLIATAEILRQRYGFRGYLHLKIMPGAEKDQVVRTMQLADRVSVNLEAPNDRRLQMLAPRKDFFDELVRPLQWVEETRQMQPGRQGWNGRWPSTTTQFVVGAAGESDLEILTTTEYLTKRLHLRRAYFSAFSPVSDTPLENRAAENPWRQHRLYQTSFLFRDYGFGLEELPFDEQGNLSLDMDPKMAWAQTNLSQAPVELNRAGTEELLRVPGIGPKSAQKIIVARRQGKLRDLQDLRAIGVQTQRLSPFVLLDGKRPLRQLPLF